MDADGLQSEPLRTGSSTLLNATEACAEGLVEEDVLAVNNTTNSEDEVFEEVIYIACIIHLSTLI